MSITLSVFAHDDIVMSINFYTISQSLMPIVTESTQAIDQPKAAVLVLLKETRSGFSVLLTQRAIAMRHHGGEVAFPGGMVELHDAFPVGTALRESYEEVGLPIDNVSVLGQLPAFYSRAGIEVVPVVGQLQREVELNANAAEIKAMFWVPTTYFLADTRVRTDVFKRGDKSLWAPVYDYEGYEIWGLTSGILVECLRRCFNMPLLQSHSAPEKHWSITQ